MLASRQALCTNYLRNIQKTVLNLWRYIYPPLPENISERKKMVVIDFFVRLIVTLPMTLLGYLGSKYQLLWIRLAFNVFSRIHDKSLGENGSMKVTQTLFAGVPVRVYEPKKRSGKGAILFMHGGGFVTGSVGTHDYPARSISEKCGLVLISIEYRLAPEHKYPAAVEDCERVAVHFLTSAYKIYSIDPHNVALMGDSAGGTLAAVTTQRLRAMDVPLPKMQVLIYPMVQMLDFQMPSCRNARQFERTSLLTPTMAARFILHYLLGEETVGHYVQDLLVNNHTTPEQRKSLPFADDLPGKYSYGDRVLSGHLAIQPSESNAELCRLLEPYATDHNVNPLLYPRLEGSPMSMVITVQNDLLRDEGILFAEKLRKAGVNVHHKNYEGFHGMLIPGIRSGQQAIEDIVRFVLDHM